MNVGAISFQLTVPGCRSLKDKRAVVRSLKDRIRHRFNVSVAETDHHDVWSRAELSVAVVSGDVRFVDQVLDKIDRFVREDGRATVSSSQREYL